MQIIAKSYQILPKLLESYSKILSMPPPPPSIKFVALLSNKINCKDYEVYKFT